MADVNYLNINQWEEIFNSLTAFFGYYDTEERINSKMTDMYRILCRYEYKTVCACSRWLKENFVPKGKKSFPLYDDFKEAYLSVTRDEQTNSRTDGCFDSSGKCTGKEAKWYNACTEIIQAMHRERVMFDGRQLGPVTVYEPSPVLGALCDGSGKAMKKSIADGCDTLARYYWEWAKLLKTEYKKSTHKVFSFSGQSISDGVEF